MSSQDPREYLNDSEEAQRLAMEGNQAGIWTAMPCIVQSVDLTKMTLSCVIAIQGRMEDQNGLLSFVNISPIQDVPIVFPSAGGFTITMPIAVGDEVLVLFAARCIDSWWQNGGFGNVPMEYRMHDLSDGFAIPGPKSVPRAIASISATDLQIRNDAGTTYLSIGADGKIGFTNATVSLNKVLTDLETLLNTFMTVLAGFGGGGAPVTQAMLQAPAAAAVTSLSSVLAEIGALLK
jgi:hypothetical protein